MNTNHYNAPHSLYIATCPLYDDTVSLYDDNILLYYRGIKHDFPFINIRKVPREVLKTEGPCEC